MFTRQATARRQGVKTESKLASAQTEPKLEANLAKPIKPNTSRGGKSKTDDVALDIAVESSPQQLSSEVKPQNISPATGKARQGNASKVASKAEMAVEPKPTEISASGKFGFLADKSSKLGTGSTAPTPNEASKLAGTSLLKPGKQGTIISAKRKLVYSSSEDSSSDDSSSDDSSDADESSSKVVPVKNVRGKLDEVIDLTDSDADEFSKPSVHADSGDSNSESSSSDSSDPSDEDLSSCEEDDCNSEVFASSEEDDCDSETLGSNDSSDESSVSDDSVSDQKSKRSKLAKVSKEKIAKVSKKSLTVAKSSKKPEKNKVLKTKKTKNSEEEEEDDCTSKTLGSNNSCDESSSSDDSVPDQKAKRQKRVKGSKTPEKVVKISEKPVTLVKSSKKREENKVSKTKNTKYSEEEETGSQRIVIFIAHQKQPVSALRFYDVANHKIFNAANTHGQTLVQGAFYAGSLRGQRFLGPKRVTPPVDFDIPDLSAKCFKVAKNKAAEKTGLVMLGQIASVDGISEVKTKKGDSVAMRECLVNFRSADKGYHALPVTVWGKHTKTSLKEGSWAVFLNAKQADFQGMPRFSVGDSGAIAVVKNVTPQIHDLSKFFSGADDMDDSNLPDGVELWQEDKE